jgi:hypothetical protein
MTIQDAPKTTGLKDDNIPRETAVAELEARVRANDAYIVLADMGMFSTTAAAMVDVPGWTAYLDTGIDSVLRTQKPLALMLSALLLPDPVLVIAVPKTGPEATARLAEALGQRELPENIPVQIVDPQRSSGFLPRLYVEAYSRANGLPIPGNQRRSQFLAFLFEELMRRPIKGCTCKSCNPEPRA